MSIVSFSKKNKKAAAIEAWKQTSGMSAAGGDVADLSTLHLDDELDLPGDDDEIGQQKLAADEQQYWSAVPHIKRGAQVKVVAFFQTPIGRYSGLSYSKYRTFVGQSAITKQEFFALLDAKSLYAHLAKVHEAILRGFLVNRASITLVMTTMAVMRSSSLDGFDYIIPKLKESGFTFDPAAFPSDRGPIKFIPSSEAIGATQNKPSNYGPIAVELLMHLYQVNILGNLNND